MQFVLGYGHGGGTVSMRRGSTKLPSFISLDWACWKLLVAAVGESVEVRQDQIEGEDNGDGSGQRGVRQWLVHCTFETVDDVSNRTSSKLQTDMVDANDLWERSCVSLGVVTDMTRCLVYWSSVSNIRKSRQRRNQADRVLKQLCRLWRNFLGNYFGTATDVRSDFVSVQKSKSTRAVLIRTRPWTNPCSHSYPELNLKTNFQVSVVKINAPVWKLCCHGQGCDRAHRQRPRIAEHHT